MPLLITLISFMRLGARNLNAPLFLFLVSMGETSILIEAWELPLVFHEEIFVTKEVP